METSPQPERTPPTTLLEAPAAAPAAGGPSEIRTEGLVKVYGQRSVVNGVNINVKAGEIVGLLGPNGAGKTTTFYMVVGLVPATAGRVFVKDQDATHLRMHRRARLGVGYLPQEPSIFRKLTVEENVLAIVETLPVSSQRSGPSSSRTTSPSSASATWPSRRPTRSPAASAAASRLPARS